MEQKVKKIQFKNKYFWMSQPMALRDFSYNNQSKFTAGYTTEPMEFVALKNPSKFLAETHNNGMHANGKSHKYQFEQPIKRIGFH